MTRTKREAEERKAPSAPSPYGQSLALLTDLYQLTMAYGYWKSAMADHEAVFHLFFRKHPFEGGFTIACGLEKVLEFLRSFRYDKSDLSYLETLRGNDQKPMLSREFLDVLGGMEFACDIDAVPEGTVVFPHEPLLRVQGPLLQCQLLESTLLNIVNFQTLIATKAARVCLAAQGDPVLEFGMRRAQGIDGALAASRAAYVGGCAGVSNVLAGKLYGIPVKGTHAHSWVMAFDTEEESFQAYAEAMPNNSIFLVDTYDTLEGVRRAIRAGQWLAEHGHRMIGVRLDSGDLISLSIEARRMLDEAGFEDATIVASNELDEHAIAELKSKGAKINLWGVGTRLATGHDDPALGGVYKLSAIRNPKGKWKYKVKLSDEPAKVSNPGILQVRRFRREGQCAADVIYDALTPPEGSWTTADLADSRKRKTLEPTLQSEDLLVPVFRQGRCVYESPTMEEIRKRAQTQLKSLPPGVKKLVDPEDYSVGLEERLSEIKDRLIEKTRPARG